MELVSLIIMVLGLAALVGIYVISRVSRHAPQKRDENVPLLRDADGNELSSVADDVPARDGKRPSSNARNMSDVMMTNVSGKHPDNVTPLSKAAVSLPPQLVLFIAADIEAGFDGEHVLHALDNAGLNFGDMNIFHRYILTEQGEASLFSIANGVKPWTLIPEELLVQNTPGLSMILNLPSPIDDAEAINDFMRTAERLTTDLNGVLKDQNQRPITAASWADLLALAA
ncbi:cell division protein ZipA C-terminal FtsZ-binding domain-containing protein [Thiothrix fructosivorans]|jgi:cell division protein ZipA|uniref:Cell division protein ZipA n=1 Tax=Thiothrix fructosivorans TaxID=111770 RepID=A0A8B0SI73_9GAMM|nr:cell division protein ZipA C-terminal FtsZ-binding domain-containing protein [Thiothrix fructosivorans]MBO0613519.1 cell division protein ZipA C-terminal FtsZ-binding domain-containing protein [Thiothrix fructosivorans]QTX11056.1 cell division protein ZipA C-terminal FtsZ-binding domain-containing protein [Thiothrix fructosivorans]